MDKETKPDKTPKSNELKQNIHYYFNEHGLLVFTELYHQLRGYCCENACKHCPYGFKKV